MALTLYIFRGSPPARATMITAKALGISLNIHVINKETGELFSPAFLKMNPQHTVPVLYENGNVICESHAINAYLVSRYGKDNCLYPKEVYKRALVDQRLHLDTGVLFPLVRSIVNGFKTKEIKEISPKHREELKDILSIMEIFLNGKEWIATEQVTIADLSCVTTLTTLHAIFSFNLEGYPNINDWVKRCKALPWFVDDHEEIEAFKEFFKSILP